MADVSYGFTSHDGDLHKVMHLLKEAFSFVDSNRMQLIKDTFFFENKIYGTVVVIGDFKKVKVSLLASPGNTIPDITFDTYLSISGIPLMHTPILANKESNN